MDRHVCLLLVAVCFLGVTYGAPKPDSQRFQADKFLDMLASTFDPAVAFQDLLVALSKRVKIDPSMLNQNSTSSVGSPDAGSNNQNTMVESVRNCLDAPGIPGASITYTSERRVIGSRAFYQCELGHEGRSKFIRCVPGGQWEPLTNWAGCKKVDCGATVPTVADADPTVTTTTFGSIVPYKCRQGFKLSTTPANVSCLDTGVWDTPSFTCKKAPMNMHPMMAMLSGMTGGGGGGNQNPAMANMMKQMQQMQQAMMGGGAAGGMPGLAGMQNLMGGANTPDIAKMMSGFGQSSQQQTAPSPVQSHQQKKQTSMGFQLPSHLQSLLPQGLTSAQGINSQDLMTLASAGLGSANPAMRPRDLTALVSTMNPATWLSAGHGAGGRGGVPADPEKVAEQREDMIMRAMMANAMKGMMTPRRTAADGNSTAKANPAMDVMALMALQSSLAGGGAGGGGGGSGGMDPMSMMLSGMSPAMLGLGGGGGGLSNIFGGGAGGASMFGSLFGSA